MAYTPIPSDTEYFEVEEGHKLLGLVCEDSKGRALVGDA